MLICAWFVLPALNEVFLFLVLFLVVKILSHLKHAV